MKRTKTTLLLFLLFLSQIVFAQTGPWAKYDQELKDGALYREASAGNLAEVKSIIEGGGNVHYAATQTKYTILMAAAGSGKIEVVQYILNLGADPKAKDWWNQTAVDKARSVGAKDIEQLLLAAINGNKPNPPVVIHPKPIDKPQNKPNTKIPIVNTPTNASTWPPFGSYKVGDSILYWATYAWKPGVIKEIGVINPVGRVSIDYSHRKYLIDPDAYALGDDWYLWTGVVKPARQLFWTNWFIGTWELGEVMAHHNDIKNGKETDTYYYMNATEALRVNADGTYVWKYSKGKEVKGKWIAAKDQPGIVLIKAYRDFDWTIRNATSVDDRSIRKLDIIDLQPSATVGGTRGRRKSTLQ